MQLSSCFDLHLTTNRYSSGLSDVILKYTPINNISRTIADFIKPVVYRNDQKNSHWKRILKELNLEDGESHHWIKNAVIIKYYPIQQ